MRYLKYALLVVGTAALSAGATRYFYANKLSASSSADQQVMGTQHEAIARLQSAQESLKAALAQNQKQQEALEAELASGKKSFSDLQGKLRDVIAQNRTLIKKVALYQVEEQRNEGFRQKLRENIKRNEELGQELLALKKKLETDRPAAAAAVPPALPATDLDKQVAWLKTKDALDQLELNKRQERIQSLQDAIQKMQDKLSLALEQFKDMEKESALLRERNVALQIERENLIGDLNDARSELGQMQEKLSQIGGLLLSGKAQAGQEAQADQPPEKKVDVELQGEQGGKR